MKVLIIDDNPAVRGLLKNILMGAWVIDPHDFADSQAAAAEKDWKPDLVLVDYDAKPLSGAAFTKLLRRGGTAADPRTPVIMLTSTADRDHVLAARDAQVDGLIVKPLSIEAVVGRVRAALARPRDVVMVA